MFSLNSSIDMWHGHVVFVMFIKKEPLIIYLSIRLATISLISVNLLKHVEVIRESCGHFPGAISQCPLILEWTLVFTDARVCNFSEGIKKKTTKYHLSDVDKFFAINKEGFKEKKTFFSVIFRYCEQLKNQSALNPILRSRWPQSVLGGVFSI